MRRAASLLLLSCLAGFAAPATGVRMREEKMSIPTYLSGPPDTTPIFYDGRTYQGARGAIYPYPIIDKLSDTRQSKSYQAIWLENRYLKVCVLPELGGRVFAAEDKTNGYDFFYRQHVIKPQLIGMVGAWISGGVEWNVPHHHRASSFMPLEYTLQENADGSKTVWLGELEWRHRMRWVVGLTLYPEKAYLEATVRVLNRTPVAQSFLYFANVAVHTNPEYQVIFPPSVQFATQHSKVEFSRWPFARGIYGGVDFSKGVDVSWWKNHPKPTSMFAFDCKEDFLAGYDHRKQAGTLHIADHGVMPGKKFFAWGPGSEGVVWDSLLTDTDGPYLELMVGGYSDNQPDYSWVQPHEAKSLTETWYPFQKIGSVKNANREAAVNLEAVRDRRVRIGLHTTAEHPAAQILLQARGARLLAKTCAIDPGHPFLTEIDLPQGVAETDLRISLSSGGKELIAYQPAKTAELPMPAPVEPPQPPARVATAEELYLTGLRLQQFHSPAADPDPYFEEALRRDPSDYRSNTALGILYYSRGDFERAEQRLRAAVARITKNYTSPKDGEPLYYLGLVLKAQGKLDEAHEVLYKVVWSYAWQTPAFYNLAEVSCQRGDVGKALEFVERAINTNASDTKAWALKAALLRKTGNRSKAAQAAAAALALDPLDPWPQREYRLAAGKPAGRADVQSLLETAVDYGNAGLLDDAVNLLLEMVGAYPDKSRVHPMVYYYLGFYSEKLRKPEAAQYYRLAANASSDYCFPFRLESINVLRKAMSANNTDARAPYYLGNLLYDLQPSAAVRHWETARALNPSFALVYRNLGFAYMRIGQDYPRAIAALETAVTRKPDARFLFELDQAYEYARTSPEKRLSVLEKNHETVLERDDTLSREIRLLVNAGKCDEALELLASRRFHVWEGGGRFSVHDAFIDAHLRRGYAHLRAKRFADALRDFETALEYPENFSVGKPYGPDRSPQMQYFIGRTHEEASRASEAKAAYQRAVAAMTIYGASRRLSSEASGEVLYYQGLALAKLGRGQQASEIFHGLIQTGLESLKSAGEVDYFAKFGDRQPNDFRLAQAHYVMALGHLGSGETARARQQFEEALKLNPGHSGASLQFALWGKD